MLSRSLSAAAPFFLFPLALVAAGSIGARESVRAQESEPADGPSPGDTRIVGRVVDSEGKPLAAELDLRGRPANSDRVFEFGDPGTTEWTAASVDEGRFELQFHAHRAAQYKLSIVPQGHAVSTWSWHSIEPGQTLDLGLVEVAPEATLEVRVTRPDGGDVTSSWVPWVQVPTEGDWKAPQRHRGSFDAERSAWVISNLPEGPTQVGASGPFSAQIAPVDVALVSGEVRASTLEFDGPDRSGELQLLFRSGLPFSPPLDVERVRLLDPTGKQVEAHEWGAPRMISESLVLTLSDAVAGDYSIQVNDPRYAPIAQSGFTRGTYWGVFLTGANSVVLELVDADGDSVDAGHVSAKYVDLPPETRRRDPAVQLLSEGAALPEDGRLTGLFPNDLVLQVNADGFEPASRRLSDWEFGEERKVRVELTPVSEPSGR